MIGRLVNNKLENMCKEEVLISKYPRGNQGNRKEPQSGQPVIRSRFETGTKSKKLSKAIPVTGREGP
jgi:hypothetical protein